jgi:twitching motility two-component system response regulator PilH
MNLTAQSRFDGVQKGASMALGKILAVDDSDTELAILSAPLRRQGYTVVTASNAEQALAQLERESPDLMLLDVVMPGVNGFQFCRNLRRDPRFANLPIIMVTSKDQPSDRAWGLRQGASEYLTKPVSMDDLIATVNQFI